MKREKISFWIFPFIALALAFFGVKADSYISANFSEDDPSLFKAAESDWNAQQWDKALSNYKKLIERSPDSPYAAKSYIRQGMYFKYQKEWSKAIAEYEKAVRGFPGTRDAQDAKTAIAAVYSFREEFPQALSLFHEVLQETSDWDQIKYCSYWIREIKRRMTFEDKKCSKCGPAALNEVFRLSDMQVSLDEISNMIPAKKDRISMQDLKKVAEKKGLKAIGVNLTLTQL